MRKVKSGKRITGSVIPPPPPPPPRCDPTRVLSCIYSKMFVLFCLHLSCDQRNCSVNHCFMTVLMNAPPPPCLSRCHRCGGQSLLCDSSFTNWHLLRSFPEVHWEQVDGELLRREVWPSRSQTASHCQWAQQLVCSLGATFSSLKRFWFFMLQVPTG